MCRFLLIHSKKEIKIEKFLISFARKCQKSKEWQGDGWGICWLNPKNEWEIKKFLSPIWKDKKIFSEIPKSKIFLVHARSSSFEKDRGKIKYNQPFLDKKIAFVFNGMIIGMKPINIEGEIGSEKVFNLIKKFSKKVGILEAIKKTKEIIEKNSRKIEGLNLAICDKEKFYLLCRYGKDRNYYGIKYFNNEKMKIVSSEAILNFPFKTMKNSQILIL